MKKISVSLAMGIYIFLFKENNIKNNLIYLKK
jgi:hypothetical protein